MPFELIVSYDGEDQALLVGEEDVILFEKGLVGFPQWRRFVLLEDPEAAPVFVLQCLDDTDVSFLVTDPRHVVPDYAPRFPAEELGKIGLPGAEEGRVLCILAASDGPVRVTANLLGPIVINVDTRRARQVVLQDSPYSARHPVLALEDAVMKDNLTMVAVA